MTGRMGFIISAAANILLSRAWLAACALLVSGATHCALAAEVSANFAPNDPPGECRSQARDYANTRYSPLDAIWNRQY